jgi:integrase
MSAFWGKTDMKRQFATYSTFGNGHGVPPKVSGYRKPMAQGEGVDNCPYSSHIRIVQPPGGLNHMAKSRLSLVSPATVKRTVTPTRRPNSELRPREHLTEREVEKLIRHGLRASELCGLQWSDIEFASGTLHLRRAKGGQTSTHPLLGDELRVLRALKRDARSPFIFVSERGAPFSVSGLQKLVERAGIAAKMPFKVHPHMLRHATGYALANRGTDTRTLQAYLGHRSIQSTVRYTELAPGRFKNLWR